MDNKTKKERDLDALHRQKAALEREINKSAIFAEGVKSDFWKEVERIVEAKLFDVEKKLTEYELHDSTKAYGLLGERKQLVGFLRIRDFLKSRNILSQRYAQVMKKIKEIRGG